MSKLTRKSLLLVGLSLLVSLGSSIDSHAADVKVFLMGGQSNMLGRAQTTGLPVALQGTQNDVLLFGGSDGTVGTTLTNLQPDGKFAGEFGPEVTFGRTMADTYPNTDFALIKYAAGGTNLSSQWKPTAGTEYLKFKQTVSAGLQALRGAGHNPEIIGMLWHQGESDVGTTQALYETRLSEFIADMRSNYGTDLPFMIGEIRRRSTGSEAISDAQAAVGAADPFATFVPASDLTFGDNVHFDAAGMITLGERFATQYQADYGSLVPEPSSLALLGLGGVLLARRRK